MIDLSLLQDFLVEAGEHLAEMESDLLQLETDPERQRAFLATVATYFGLVGLFFWLALSLYANEIIMLLTRRPEFWVGAKIIPIAAFTSVLEGYGSFLGIGMVMTNRSHFITMSIVISAAANLALNFVLVPPLGMVGAALSTLLAYLLWDGLKLYFSWKFYDIRVEGGRLCHLAAATAALYGASFLLPSSASIWTLLGAKGLLLCSYPVVIYRTGFFRTDEKKKIWKLYREFRAAGPAETLRRAGRFLRGGGAA